MSTIGFVSSSKNMCFAWSDWWITPIDCRVLFLVRGGDADGVGKIADRVAGCVCLGFDAPSGNGNMIKPPL